ncbi:MAG: hypothetical protein ABI743_14010 [bacterium]
MRLVHGLLVLVMALTVTACGKDGKPIQIDRTGTCAKILAETPPDKLQIYSVFPGDDKLLYMRGMYQAYAQWPDYDQSKRTMIELYTKPPKFPVFDLPELYLILGAMDRMGYDELPTERFSQIFMARVFAKDAKLFPDPTRDDPPGTDRDALLVDSFKACETDLRPKLQQRLDRMFTGNPNGFSMRDPAWALRLIAGNWGDLEQAPEVVFQQAIMCAVMLGDKKIEPALVNVVNEKKTTHEYQFAAATGSYLFNAGTGEAGATYAKRVYGNEFVRAHHTPEMYRVMAKQQDPLLYTAIKKALAELPEEQHIDYLEYLAAYGKPEDLEMVKQLMETPVDISDVQLTQMRSQFLVNPNTLDVKEATQRPEIIQKRKQLVMNLPDPAEEAAKAKDKASGQTIIQANDPASQPVLIPKDALTDREMRHKVSRDMNIDASALLTHTLLPEQIMAQRLWWLRAFPFDSIKDILLKKLKSGTEQEQVVAIRMIALYGGPEHMDLLGVGLNSEGPGVATEAAVWYMRYKREQENAGKAAAETTDPAPTPAAPEGSDKT